MTLDIDSDYILSQCDCKSDVSHAEKPCKQFAIPARAVFSRQAGFVERKQLDEIYYSKFDRDHVLCIKFFSANVQIHDRVCTTYIEYYL